ncbi:MAG: hypothetical protein HOM46_00190 [Nitrosomonadales bacterium]|nr:hypothetical protein [Nitrosomonadales bacterium]
MHPLLNTAIKAARRAGSIITRASEDISSLTITSKNMNDFVSEVDLASEKEIIRVLSQAYPDRGFIAEESGLSEKKEILGCLRRNLHVTVLYKQTSNTVPGDFLGRLVLGAEDNEIKIFGATIY